MDIEQLNPAVAIGQGFTEDRLRGIAIDAVKTALHKLPPLAAAAARDFQLSCEYRGVDGDTGKPMRKDTMVRFEWRMLGEGVDKKQPIKVRCNNVGSRGVKFPDEWCISSLKNCIQQHRMPDAV